MGRRIKTFDIEASVDDVFEILLKLTEDLEASLILCNEEEKELCIRTKYTMWTICRYFNFKVESNGNKKSIIYVATKPLQSGKIDVFARRHTRNIMLIINAYIEGRVQNNEKVEKAFRSFKPVFSYYKVAAASFISVAVVFLVFAKIYAIAR